ncbi:MAG: AmmeMemoRadiSam system protein B [candidate division KSB1 bacterium]|nr:AmmeMemoRadiSam system protein B [candidate division KSB1 bacterium]
MKDHIRKSAVAGSWYPGDQKQLNKLISNYLNEAEKANIKGDIIALVSPHAGYDYSGAIAASAYKQVMGKSYDAVIVLAPSHRESFKGVSIYTGSGYETPLGIVPVNMEIAEAIVNYHPSIIASTAGHREEHSLEIQLPFMQIALPELTIVPISIWDYSYENCHRLADAIVKAVKGKKILLIASTDLYHGYSYDDCLGSDDKTINMILAMKPQAFCEAILNRDVMACGGGPVAVAELVAMELGADKATMVKRINSSDVTGDRGGYVVGYASIAIYQSTETDDEKIGVELGLNEEDKKTLLKIAREAIEHGVEYKSPPQLKPKSQILKEKRGAFVTLNKDGMLRGCIGYIVATKPLGETVQEMAAAAAFRDPRFSPVRKEEVGDLEIEISVLTPLKQIRDIQEIEVGVHGLMIEKGGRSGLLLPQVAVDYKWDKMTFLEHTCKKAGLSADSWKSPDAVIKIFSAEIFHER